MLEVVDVGVAHMTKREKMLRYYGRVLPVGMPNDQDAYMLDNILKCYAVADGVGNSKNSEKASKAVVEEYRQVIKDLYAADTTANITQQSYVTETLARINAAAVDVLATTTFTGMAVHPNNTASYLHVGDSQLLLYRNDELVYCTSEHVEDGNKLLNYLGTQPEWAAQGYARHALEVTVEANSFSATKFEAEWGEILLQDGDRFALVTDGILGSSVHERLDDRILKRYMNRRLGAIACANELLAESRKEDDSTIIIVDIGTVLKTSE
jgi:serine/threonine protein phosphatase PrpC